MNKVFCQRLKASLLLITAAGSGISDQKVETAIQIYSQITNTTLLENAVRSEALDASSRIDEIKLKLSALSEQINDQAKALLIKSMVIVAAQNGVLDEKKWEAFCLVGDSLQMDNAVFQANISSISTSAG